MTRVLNNVKIGDNQNLGTQEINQLKNYLSKYGINHAWRDMVESFGIVRSPNDTSNQYFKVYSGGVLASDEIGVQDGVAIDDNFNIIVHANDDYNRAQTNVGIQIPDGTNYVFMSYMSSGWEEGTVSISSAGVVTGVGTKFTEVLRAANKFPVKIAFITLNNAVSSEFEVISVASDTSCTIKGSSFPSGTLYYKVIGSFDFNKTIPSQDKDIYEYGAAQFRVSTSSTPAAGEFLLAIVTASLGNIDDVIDQRAQSIFRMSTYVGEGVRKNTVLSDLTDSITGLEWEEYTNDTSKNRVKIAWGIRASAWTFDPSLNQFTITAISSGGIYGDDIANVPSGVGDLNFMEGWRVYLFRDGEYNYYGKVTAASNVAGFVVITDIGLKDVTKLPPPFDLVLVPDGDYIEIQTHGVTGVLGGINVEPSARIQNNNRRHFVSQIFPIFSQYGIMDVDTGLRNGTKLQTNQRLLQDGVTTKFVPIAAGNYYGADKFDLDDGASNGAAVNAVDGSGQWTPEKRSWVAMTLESSWSNRSGNTLEYLVDGEMVHVRGVITEGGSPPTNVLVSNTLSAFPPNRDIYATGMKHGQVSVGDPDTEITGYKLSSSGALTIHDYIEAEGGGADVPKFRTGTDYYIYFSYRLGGTI